MYYVLNKDSFLYFYNSIKTSLEQYISIDNINYIDSNTYRFCLLALHHIEYGLASWAILIKKESYEYGLCSVSFLIDYGPISLEKFLESERVPNLIKKKLIFNIGLFANFEKIS